MILTQNKVLCCYYFILFVYIYSLVSILFTMFVFVYLHVMNLLLTMVFPYHNAGFALARRWDSPFYMHCAVVCTLFTLMLWDKCCDVMFNLMPHFVLVRTATMFVLCLFYFTVQHLCTLSTCYCFPSISLLIRWYSIIHQYYSIDLL